MEYSSNSQDKVVFIFDDATYFIVECTTDIAPSYNSTVATHKVESGGRKADHIIKDPIALNMSMKQSDLEGQSGAYDKYFSGKHIELHERLFAAWNNEEVLTADAHIRGVFADYAITSYTPTQTAAQGRALHFNIALQALDFAESKKRKIKRPGAAEPKATSAKNLGQKTPRAPSARVAGIAQRNSAGQNGVKAAQIFNGG